MENKEKEGCFRKGSRVEVCSLEDGFQNAWFPAVILQPSPSSHISPSPKSTRTKTKKKKLDTIFNFSSSMAVVRYDHMLTDDGSDQLVEEVDVSLLRPMPPSDTTAAAADQSFEPNDVVDAFDNDTWWTGVVLEVVDDKYTVFFKNPPDLLECRRSELRHHWDWVNSKWVRPEKQAIKESIFSPGTAVEVNLDKAMPCVGWFPAVVLGELDLNYFMVRYKNSKNGAEEKVAVHLELIRPQPPENNHENSFDLLDKVDAFFDFRWWVGLVSKILAEKRYIVTFRHEKKVKEFNHSELRPHLDWVDGQWLTNSREVGVTSVCQERSKHDCDSGKSFELINGSSGSTLNDIVKGTPCSTNKQGNQKNLSLCVDKSSCFENSKKEKVNQTSNGDISAEVIQLMDDGETKQQEGGNHVTKFAKMRAGRRKSQFTVMWPRSRKKCRISNSEVKILPTPPTVKEGSALNITNEDYLEVNHVIEELKVSGMLEEPDGVKVSDVENSCRLPTEDKQKYDAGANSGIKGKGERSESVIVNLQAAEAGKEHGARGVVADCTTNKSKSPVTAGVQLTDEPEFCTALACQTSTNVVPLDKTLSKHTEETHSLTNADEPEDGIALAPPTSRNIVLLDKALSMCTEETRYVTNGDETEDGTALASPTSRNIVSSGKALSMCIEETQYLTNADEPENGPALASPTSTSITHIASPEKALSMHIDETHSLTIAGNIVQTDIQSLPFVKSSPIWKLIESMEVFRKLPQKPHFLPLLKVKEIKREAFAIGSMVNFASLIEKISQLQQDVSREYIASILEELAELEELGFDVKVVHRHLNEMLKMKIKLEELQNKSKSVQIRVTEYSEMRTKVDGEVTEIDKEIKRLAEKRAMLMIEREDKGSKISKLLSEAAVINEAILNTTESLKQSGIMVTVQVTGDY